jgi:hypothetical protein
MKSEQWHDGFTSGFMCAGFVAPVLYAALDMWFHGWIWRVAVDSGWLS